MNKYLLAAIISFSSFLSPQRTYCYEIPTHTKITEKALEKSLATRSFLRDIGYIESSDIITYTYPNDASYLSGMNSTSTKSILDWMMYGSEDEDSTFTEAVARYENHFYDPVNNMGYHWGIFSGYKAPDWALEDISTYATQMWSLQDAKSYYIAALTSSTKKDRDNNFAKTFTALGHVLHLVEDMAQPQHTRNDSHGSGSQYELQLKNERPPASVFNSSYEPVFSSYRGFFYTSDGKGLADFSNRSFVTEGTNFSCTNFDPSNPSSTCLNAYYPNPVLNVSRKEEVQITDLLTELGMSNPTNLSGVVTFFGNSITDAYSGETFENSRMTTYSIFDKDLQAKGLAPAFTLNKANYNKMAEYLLPRAVGYSAGLLNYFFRGQMDTSGHETTDLSGNVTGLTVDVKNLTTNEEMAEGKLVVSYRYKEYNSTEYTYGISSEINSGTLASNAPGYTKFTFTFTDSIPNNVTDVQYTLVFHDGYLGNEQNAVVGKIIDTEAFKFKLTRDDGLLLTPANLATAYAPTLFRQLYIGVYDSFENWIAGGGADFSNGQKRYNNITFDENTNYWVVKLPLGYREPTDNKGFWAEYYSSIGTAMTQYPYQYKESNIRDVKDLIRPGVYEDRLPLYYEEEMQWSHPDPKSNRISTKAYSSVPVKVTYGYYNHAVGYYDCGQIAGNTTVSTDGGLSAEISQGRPGIDPITFLDLPYESETFVDYREDCLQGCNLSITYTFNGPDTAEFYDGVLCSFSKLWVPNWTWGYGGRNHGGGGMNVDYDY